MKVTHNNIKDFLYTPGKYFVIPDFQRPYSWEKSNVDSFLSDLETVLERNKAHFFGSVVYINEGDDSVIIDGQQRSTTVLLMLTALYHLALEHPEKSAIPAEQIMKSYLFNEFAARIGNEENRIKLRTVTTDNEIFERIFERAKLAEKHQESKLYRVYFQFYNYFAARDSLDRYINILDKFEIVTIALDAGDDNPQEVFESINSTGKPLSDGDKIRNFALMLSDKQARQLVLEKYWNVVERNLTVVNKDYITDFFRMYLVSVLQHDVKLELVYPEFKRQFEQAITDQSDTASLEAFYGVVLRQLEHYLFLKFNRDDNGLYTDFKDKAFRLNFLKIEIVNPFLMKLLDRYRAGELDSAAVQRVFEIVETFLVRRIICNMATTGLNNLFSILDKEVSAQLQATPGASYGDVLTFVLNERTGATHLPTNAEVELAVSSNPFYKQRNWYNNFILSSVDDKAQSKESALLHQIARGDVELSIEHIMPQTLTSDWQDMLGPDYENIHNRYVHTLPNLTLTGYNSKYSNNDFVTKKTIENGFNQSPLHINSFVRAAETWDEAALTARATWWNDQINKIWPLPTTSYQAPNDDIEYMFKDDEDLSHTKVKRVSILGETTRVESWADAFEVIVEKLFSENPDLYDFVSEDSFLSRYIRPDGDKLLKPRQINDSSYSLETGTNTNYKKLIVMKLSEHLELDDEDVKVVIAK
ncbi:MAG: hypothetical protein JWN38_1023 [Candidatus Saccharibacteria bacterium]|nr:hypothetical protein [Candidatus Saccharibacteria bacterium]